MVVLAGVVFEGRAEEHQAIHQPSRLSFGTSFLLKKLFTKYGEKMKW